MPMRVTPQTHNVVVDTSWSLQSRASESSQADDSGSGAEGPGRKRFQTGSTAATNGLSRQPSNSGGSFTRAIAEPRSSFTSRRRSVREQKTPLGPRPPDFSPSKADNLHRSLTTSTSRPLVSRTPRTAGEDRQRAGREDPRAAFGYTVPIERPYDNAENTPGSFDFLPSVSFDDLHSSIATNESKVGHFSRPSDDDTMATRPMTMGGSMTNMHDRMERGAALGGAGTATQHFTRNGSMRRQSTAARPRSQVNPDAMSMMGPPADSISSRTRRQSQFPPMPSQGTTRNVRKSVGPGVLDTSLANQSVVNRSRPRLAANGLRTPSTELSSSRDKGPPAKEPSRFLTTSRDVKAKSLQPPPHQAPLGLSLTPDQARSRSSFIGTGRSPGKSPARRSNTPSSSGSKRLSQMPGHSASGLGARTTSPTDTRRMKRMSMMQEPPPMPRTPSTPATPLPDAMPGTRSAAHSPSLIPRKSVTPSSNRTTPDPNRKSYSSGLSLSSNTTSNTSVRTSNGSLQQRLSQSISASRLPTPKPRNVHSSAGGETEEVPPVPAIPKAYESPKESSAPSYFMTRKSSLPMDSSTDTSTTDDALTAAVRATKAARAERELQAKRAMSFPRRPSEGDTAVTATPAASRRNLQPLRLPPLNLLPLSTPTVARVAALHDRTTGAAAAAAAGRATPPMSRGKTKTPTTPMTASKASFFSQSQYEQNTPILDGNRAESASLQVAPSSKAAAMEANEALAARSGRHTMTPSSTSLMKMSGDVHHVRPKDSGEYNTINLGNESRTTKLTGPRAQTATKAHDSNGRSTSPSDAETPSSGSSIRKKMSLGFRRSSSKNLSDHEVAEAAPPQPPKHDNMPPPKLPASATWTGQIIPSPSPSQKPQPVSHLQSRRRQSSNPNMSNGHSRGLSESWGARISSNPTKAEASSTMTSLDPAPPPPRTTSSILSPMHKILGSKSSASSTKNRGPVVDPDLDPDDQAAEEEMRKLAAKRKDVEAAAKEVDSLRRRATPKERAAPSHAVRVANLNIFERGEIIDYKDIYFCGTPTARKHVGDLNQQPSNFGYDDERGDYNIVNGDHLAYRYEIIDILGKGSFGQVVRCIDHKHGGLVAVKIIRNKKRFHQQALVEVSILQKLREWDPQNKHSMVTFTQSFYFRGHLCISTELLGMNLYEFIKSNNFQGFSLKLIRRFTKQLLSSLTLLKGHRVIHCDLKPENVLLAHPVHSEIKVIDFGSSCFENEKVYTYIQSRFYRSPEVILGMTYGLPIDMWSLGCILAELYTGYPIFPGENEQEQLACIMEVFGPPEKHLIEKSTRKKLFFDSMGKPRLTVSSKGRRRRPSSKSLQQALKCDDEAFLDFLTRCLRWDPDRRLKAEEAMEHEFVTGLRRNARGGGRGGLPMAHATPAKRGSTIHNALSATRPLPEPPSTGFKMGGGTGSARNRDAPNGSPSKQATTTTNRRQSTMAGQQTGLGIKRSSTGVTIGSNLPRVTPRSASNKGEMAATAAAIATNAWR